MRRFFSSVVFSATAMLSIQAQAGDISVLSAVVKDKAIEDAKITWQRNGEGSQQTQTSSDGKASMPSEVIDDANTTMIINKPGYSTLVVKCPCDNFTYALSPVMQNLDGLRVVLTWGEEPKDLDSHLIFPNNHVFFKEKVGSETNLDVDDTTSFGPETITIERKKSGQNYIYAVHDYINGYHDRKNSDDLSLSNARVEVYVGKTLIRTYRAKRNTNATAWVVFGIDKDGAFHDINQYLSMKRKDLASHMKKLVGGGSFEDHSLVTPAIIKEAKRINTRGESLYHDKKLEDAMYIFQDAINLYPSYGQAYSNLGLTYQKLGRTAEALWANRKAIELASGSTKNRVQASSYYNIARIYEGNSQWQDALNNFQKAKSLRQHSAYDKGIARMQKELQ